MLVVDDEASVREVLRRYLDRRGWLVAEAPSAEEALALLDAQVVPVDAMIVDMHLPGLSGSELCRRITALRPDLAGRLIVATGDTPSATAELARAALRCRVLSKPFELEELDDAIAGMLAE